MRCGRGATPAPLVGESPKKHKMLLFVMKPLRIFLPIQFISGPKATLIFTDRFGPSVSFDFALYWSRSCAVHAARCGMLQKLAASRPLRFFRRFHRVGDDGYVLLSCNCNIAPLLRPGTCGGLLCTCPSTYTRRLGRGVRMCP
jgi:hypothetical protein